MDLVVLIDDPNAALEPSHFVQMIGDLLERETNFVVSVFLWWQYSEWWLRRGR